MPDKRENHQGGNKKREKNNPGREAEKLTRSLRMVGPNFDSLQLINELNHGRFRVNVQEGRIVAQERNEVKPVGKKASVLSSFENLKIARGDACGRLYFLKRNPFVFPCLL